MTLWGAVSTRSFTLFLFGVQPWSTSSKGHANNITTTTIAIFNQTSQINFFFVCHH
mgnify:FL=1